MAELKGDAVIKSIESLLADRQAVAEKEKALIAELNRLLGPIGYGVVPARDGARGAVRGRRRRRRGGPGRARAVRPTRRTGRSRSRRGRPPKKG
jgi:hypothetical protein